MPARGVGKRFWQRVHALFAPLESLCSEVLHHAAYFLGRWGGRQWLSKRDAPRVGNAPRKFPKEAPAGKTENRAPHAVEIHRDDGHVDALDNALHAPPKRHHLPDTRHLSFREDAHRFAVL